jgi:hypothetical protein
MRITQFISRKDKDGNVKHIPMRGSPGWKFKQISPNIVVRKMHDGTEDLEYMGRAESPERIMSDVKKEVLHRLHTNAVKSTEEEYFYDESGRSITKSQFLRTGGSFDYIVESAGAKYQVNGEINKKDRTWKLSGLGSWIQKPEGHLYRNGAESFERKKFEKRYGKKKGDHVYGAVVGKVKREQLARRGKR